MKADQTQQIKALSSCTFLPGSYVKRFVRDMATKPIDDDLTEKQAQYLAKLYWQYRRQINQLRDQGWVYPEPVDYREVQP